MTETEQTFLGIIPARSGSKGVKDKNIREISGKPLIHYTIEDARGSDKLSQHVVSTDSEKYAKIAREAGGNVPFLRPKKFATDESPTIDVVKHVVKTYEAENDIRIDATVLLQPTTPLRTPSDIDNSINVFLKSNTESLISCYETVHSHPNHLYEMNENNKLVPLRDQDEIPHRRQEFELVYLLNGAVYISSRKLIFENDRLKGEIPAAFTMPRKRSVNIDEKFDLQLAEFLIEHYNQG